MEVGQHGQPVMGIVVPEAVRRHALVPTRLHPLIRQEYRVQVLQANPVIKDLVAITRQICVLGVSIMFVTKIAIAPQIHVLEQKLPITMATTDMITLGSARPLGQPIRLTAMAQCILTEQPYLVTQVQRQ